MTAPRPRNSQAVSELWRRRPRSHLLRWTLIILAGWTAYSFGSGELHAGAFLGERRLGNLRKFFSEELMPYSLREEGLSLSGLWGWISGIWNEVGAHSSLATLQISILAICLAGLGAWPLSLLTARNFARQRPFEGFVGPRPGWRQRSVRNSAWTLARQAARFLAILLRAVPEYILAFLLLAVLDPESAWPAVLALAIHNGGILARLGGEVVENLEPAPLRALTASGARRSGMVVFAIFPLTFGRNLLYFFYRFETCVREATVLGMLGVVSLGYWIKDARAKQYYDEMFLLMLFGVGLVVLADVTSALVRRSIRRG
jgi:phosphonate transport system permease protein